jgi:rod shape-determining protein MreD
LSFLRNSEPAGVRVATRTGPNDVLLTPPWWHAALYLGIALLAQMEVLHYFTFRGAQVSVVLVVVVWYALHADLRSAAIFGLIAGLCEDVLSAQTGAAWTISTTLTALLAGSLSRWFFADSIPVVALVVFLATLLRQLVFWIVMALEGYPPGYARLHFHSALWEAAIDALFAIGALLILRYYEQRAAR